MQIKEVYGDKNGQLVHSSWCLYANEYECLQETLAYADYQKEFRFRHLDTIQNKMISLKLWYNYIGNLGKAYSNYFTLQDQSGFLSYLDSQINRQKVKPVHVVGKSKYSTGFTASTVNRHIATIREYYRFLREHGHISLAEDELPFKSLRGVKNDVFYRKEESEIPEVLTMTEVKQMIQACTTLRDKLIIVMMVTVGLRLGELCSLTTQCIDFATCTIRMNKRYLDLETGRLKTGPRTLRGNQVLFALLQRYYLLERNRYAHCDNIFINLSNRAGADVGAPMTMGAVKALFKRIKKTTRIPGCHAHALRHTFATNFLRLKEKNDKVSLAILQKLLGHKNINTTMIYTHLDYTDTDRFGVGETFENFVKQSLSDVLK